ncbi:MAG TPA: PA2169 family four-helix-bundle protein [Gillisia sp.]|nr:PA2169 family four-helix-bundle protein [Gillisia sp.]
MKTTRELAKEESHDRLVQNLQQLLVKNYDADKGIRKAFKEAKSQPLKDYFKKEALRHHRFATELDRIIHSLNATPMEEGSAVGRFHRIWMDIILAVSGNDDQTIVTETKRGQKATIKEYEEKLKNEKIPPRISEILKKQLEELKASVTQVIPTKTL